MVIKSMKVVILAAILSAIAGDTCMAAAKASHGVLPFEAAFRRPEIQTAATYSPNAKWLAVEVLLAPDNHDRAILGADRKLDSFLSSGKPRSFIGLSIYLFSEDGSRQIEILPGADAWGASWSPDSGKLAFFSDHKGPARAWVYDLETGESAPVSDLQVKAKLWRGGEARWSRDGRHLYVSAKPADQTSPYPAFDTQAEKPYPYIEPYIFSSRERQSHHDKENGSFSERLFEWQTRSELIEVNVETGAYRIAAPDNATPKPAVLRLSPSGRLLTYQSVHYRDQPADGFTRADIALVDLSSDVSSPPSVITRGAPMVWPYFKLIYRWHPDDDRLVYFEDSQLYLKDFRDDSLEESRLLSYGITRLGETVLAFTRGGDHVIVGEIDAAAEDPTQANMAYREHIAYHVLPLDGGDRWSFSLDQQWRFKSFVTVGDGALWQPDRDFVWVHAVERKTGDNVILKVRLQTGLEKEALRWGGTMSKLSGAPDQRSVSMILENINTAPQLFRFSSDFQRSRRLSNLASDLAGVDIGGAHNLPVTVPKYNHKLEIVYPSIVMPPGTKKGDAVPAVVTFYPGLNLSGETSKFMAGAFPMPWGLFTSRGYAVIFADVRIGPGDEPGNAITEITDTLLPQVYAFANAGYIDIERIALTGNSFGGYATVGVLSRTNLFRAAIPQNGIYELSGVQYGGFRSPDSPANGSNWVEKRQPRIGTHPWADLRRVIDNSPYYQADKIRTPVLIIQGGADFTFKQSQLMYTALARLEQDVRLAVFPNSGHVLSAWPKDQAMSGAKLILDFIEEHLGPGYRPN